MVPRPKLSVRQVCRSTGEAVRERLNMGERIDDEIEYQRRQPWSHRCAAIEVLFQGNVEPGRQVRITLAPGQACPLCGGGRYGTRP